MLRNIHKQILEASGEFRKEQKFLSNLISIAGVKHYNPTAPEDIPKAMEELERFINTKDNCDALIKGALAHYQFETIHPFMSGNGRVGRILPYLVLSNDEILTHPLTCLSHYLYLNKVEYIDRMKKLQNIINDYEQWIKFFLQAIVFAADDSLVRIDKWLVIREKT